jgi:membrane-associated phospholipid phosphatase
MIFGPLKPTRRYRPLYILGAGILLFVFAGIRDIAWTRHLYENPWRDFSNVMARSLFEGELPGASDIGVVIAIGVFGTWAWIKYSKKNLNQVTKQNLKFSLLSAVLTPLIIVQSLKWIIVSRARPKVYFSEILPTLPNPENLVQFFPGFMGLGGPRGYSWSSFPSGHSSTCALLLFLVYLLGRNKLEKSAIFLAVFLFTAAMAVARSMDGMHWFSDSIASFFIVWTFIDYIHYRVFQKRIL